MLTQKKWLKRKMPKVPIVSLIYVKMLLWLIRMLKLRLKLEIIHTITELKVYSFGLHVKSVLLLLVNVYKLHLETKPTKLYL